MSDTSTTKQLAWKIKAWREAVPLSHSQVCEYIANGTIPSVKIGGSRLITESPAAFLERHREPAKAAS